MAARKVATKMPGGAVREAAPEQSLAAASVLSGVLQRMGDVLGPGAIYSLVHYGAVEEGLLLQAGGSTEEAVERVGRILGVEAKVEKDRENVVHVHLKKAAGFDLGSRANVALAVGLLEGALTTARRRKMQAVEPTLGADGTLRLELAG